MLVVKDLRNPTAASGFRYVGYRKRRPESGHPVRYQAQYRGWFGPVRLTAAHAAQDACDYINGNGVSPAMQLRSAGHNGKRDSITRDADYDAALGYIRDVRAQLEGRQGYIYCIAEVPVGGGLCYGKIGYSTNPQARVAELQTGNPRPLKLLCAKKGTPADEAALHQKYISANVLQEWFRLDRSLLLEFDLDPDLNPYPTEDGNPIE